MKQKIRQVGSTSDLNEEMKERIRTLIQMAGGARLIAGQVNENYDTYHNVMRGTSTDFNCLNKMINKAKAILKEKIKLVA